MRGRSGSARSRRSRLQAWVPLLLCGDGTLSSLLRVCSRRRCNRAAVEPTASEGDRMTGFDAGAIDWKAVGQKTDHEIRSVVEEAGGLEAVAKDLLERFGLPFVRYIDLSEWIGEAGSLQLILSDG